MNSEVKKAADTLQRGGIVIFPTDTAFGIGCRIDSEKSVSRLFEVRRRSQHKATPVLVSDIVMAEDWVGDIPGNARYLVEKFWPGGLTLIFESNRSDIPKLVQGGTKTLGVRMPDHDDLREVIEEVGVPIIGSSANFEGGNTPYLFDDLNPELVRLVDFVLPGECKLKRASTVLDCTVSPFKILREGAIASEKIRDYE